MSQTAPATSTVTARQIAPYVKGIRFQGNALDRLCRMVQYGELPYAVLTACHGIQWAQQTGRLCGVAQVALDGLLGVKLAALVAEVATACPTMAEVPACLNRGLG